MSQTAALPYYQLKLHPVDDRAWWEGVKLDPRLRAVFDRVQSFADRQPALVPHPLATDFLAAKRSNNRGIVDDYWHSRVSLTRHVLNLCLDGRIDPGTGDALLNQLWLYLTCPTWVVSAHLPGQELPFTGTPQLDLAACEMAANLAETLELLKPWIDAQSKTLANSIIHEIDRRVLAPFAEDAFHSGWYNSANRWNNWSGVCAGTILAACESLAVLGHPRPVARAKALKVLDRFIDVAFTPSGECDEGMGYWTYGLGFACIGWSRLSQTELSQNVNMQRLAEVADYPRRAHVIGDWFYSGNDGELRSNPPVFCSAWLAGATGSTWLNEWARKGLQKVDLHRATVSVLLRLIEPYLLLGPGAPALPTPASANHLPDQQAVVFSDGRMQISLAGGHNDEAHNHNDLGHVNLWLDDQLILLDMGAPVYSADFFGPKRYTYLSASSRGHACPVINEQEQLPGQKAAAREIELELEKQRLVLDLTAGYPKEARLKRWTRAVSRAPGGYELTDEFETIEAVEIENVFWSMIEPVVKPGEIRLGPVTIVADPGGPVEVQPVDPAAHRLRNYHQTIYRLCFKLRTQPGAVLRFKMVIKS